MQEDLRNKVSYHLYYTGGMTCLTPSEYSLFFTLTLSMAMLSLRVVQWVYHKERSLLPFIHPPLSLSIQLYCNILITVHQRIQVLTKNKMNIVTQLYLIGLRLFPFNQYSKTNLNILYSTEVHYKLSKYIVFKIARVGKKLLQDKI